MTLMRSRRAVLSLGVLFATPVFSVAFAKPEDVQPGASLAGQLLVSEPEMGDPRFAKTVILMVQHDPKGALGIVINRPVEELYRFWRNLENLPQFMPHLESVDRVTDTLSRWRARGPGGKIVEWNAEIINEVPNQVIGWRSIEGSDVVSAGSVHFDDAGPGRGTHVRVRMQYSPPGGKIGAAVARLLGRDAATEIREDLRRFKQLLETGEVPTTHGQPRG